MHSGPKGSLGFVTPCTTQNKQLRHRSYACISQMQIKHIKPHAAPVLVCGSLCGSVSCNMLQHKPVFAVLLLYASSTNWTELC